MDLGLKGLKVLVTGASSGLGFATARIFAGEGAQVVINSRTESKLKNAAKSISAESCSQVIAIPADISQADQAQKLVAETVHQLGGLDILFTSGGGPRPGKFDTLNDADWEQAVNLCLLSYVRLVREALPALRQSAHASILMVTSISAKQPIENLMLSNSIRAGALGFTKSLALELAGENIRVNSILPGWTSTDRSIQLIQNRANVHGTTYEEELLKQNETAPMGRMASPEEFGKVAVFLSSPAASYLTGSMIAVDGGQYKALL